MKKNLMTFGKERWDDEITVAEFVEKGLRPCSYGYGVLETVEKQGELNATALTRLISILEEKNLLSQKEIFYMIHGYTPEGEE